MKFSPTLSARDHAAIRKTCSGMIKLLYPDGKYTEEQLLEIVDFAAEGRKRVKEQLYKIDETFRAEPAVFEYTILSSGEKRQIKTLEEIENESAFDSETPTTVQEAASGTTAKVPQQAAPAELPVLGPKHIYVQNNQRGISYKSLFGDYLRGAQKIVIVDPFIYKPYQLDNLADLLMLILDMNDDLEEDLRVELHTRVSDTDPKKQDEALETFKEELSREGVEFDFTYDATHDRAILVDDRWAINLGRGLDIFDWIPKHSLKHSSQKMRKCRDFQMTIAQIQSTASTEDLIAGVKSGKLKSKSEDGYLVLLGEFYDKIESGEKTVEYRDFTEYLLKRTIGIKTIRFSRGTVKNAPQMRWEVEKVVFQDAADNECDPMTTPDGFVPVRIAIYLGKRI